MSGRSVGGGSAGPLRAGRFSNILRRAGRITGDKRKGRGRVTAIKAISSNRRLCSALLLGTALGGLAAPAFAQETAQAEPTAPPAETVPQPEAPVQIVSASCRERVGQYV